MTEVGQLIADMVRAGVDPELIGRTAEALSHREAVVIHDEAAERRRAKDAERKRLRKSAEIVGGPQSDDLEVSPKEVSPAPLQEITPSPTTHKENPPKGGQKKRSRLPSDFALPDEWRSWAVARGLPQERVSVEFEKITNWAANAAPDKAAKSDWFRAWKNWVIAAIDALPHNRAGPPPKRNPALEAANRLMEQLDAVTPSESQTDQPYPRLVAFTGGG